MRVVVVSAWEPWRRTDAAASVLDHQLRVLGDRHDITLLAAGAPAATGPPPADGPLPVGQVRWFGTAVPRRLDAAGRRVWAMRHGEPAHVRYVERPALLEALAEEMSRRPDVLHLHGWGTAGLWQMADGVPTLHVVVDPWEANARNRRRSLLSGAGEAGQLRRIRDHERRHYPHLGAVVVVTAEDATALGALVPETRIEVVPNGVTAGPEPDPLPSGRVLGFHGVFDSQANVDAARALVEKVLPLVRQTVPDTEALLVGRRPPREVRALVGPGVRLVADVADIRQELAAMTVHVDWMTSGAGIKNKVLEAMAAGRPVVASAAGAAGIGAGPGLTVAADVAAAARAAATLLGSPQAAVAAGRAGRERVLESFGWDANAARIETLWAELAP